MNLQVEMDESDDENKQRSIFVCLIYNSINAFLLAPILRNTTVIRGDGPAGFGELITKGFIAYLCAAFFIGGLTASIKLWRGSKDSFRLKALSVVTSSLLLFFSAVAVFEACSDDPPLSA
tara:strand:- start:28 stop:387 length:360 start_codon:yes stop_codon:yes gene_type:complete